jgi:hypothetical protein
MTSQDPAAVRKLREAAAASGEPPINPPPAPLDPVFRADKLVAEFSAVSQLDQAAKDRLRGLILAAIDERLEEVQDVRLGRVLGSALATL